MNRREMIWMVKDQMSASDYEISDRLIDQYLNEGFHRVIGYKQWPFAIGMEPIVSVMGWGQYPILGQARTIISLLDTETGKYLRSVPFEEMSVLHHQNPQMSVPQVFTLQDSVFPLGGGERGYQDAYTDMYGSFLNAEAGKYALWVYPRSSTSGRRYDVWYNTVLDFDSSDSAEPPWTQAYHTILVDWAVHRGWERNHDFKISSEYRGRFEASLQDMVRFYNVRATDQPMIYGHSSARIRRVDEASGSMPHMPPVITP